MGIEIQTLADDMFNLVADTDGTGRYKPQDIFKILMDKYKSEGVNKKDCKSALKTLIQNEKLIYTVLNGSCTSMVCLPGCEDGNTDCAVKGT
ncbi:hypothetical protein KJ966_30385 [bacterium]|nr:hypothetical protein [bacterium]